MEEKKESILPLLFAIFGFMLIIATGVDMLLGNNKIPIIISIIGLFLIIIAMIFRKREG
jgi:small neutral amino acid transporter SnatA (MarC family)